MKKLKNNKKFQVGDVIVDTTTHSIGKILDFPSLEEFYISENNPLNKSNSYYVRWSHIDYNLNVSYDEEIRYDKNVEGYCKKVEYYTFEN
jgi:hypothetical protein